MSGRRRHAVPNLCANWLRLHWSLIDELGCLVACSINAFENIAQTHEIVLLSQSVMSISTPSGSAKACLPMGHACKSLWMRTPACRRHVFSALIVETRWRYCPGLARRHNVLHLEADVIEALAHASVQVFVVWSDQKTDFAVGERYFLVSGKLFDAL